MGLIELNRFMKALEALLKTIRSLPFELLNHLATPEELRYTRDWHKT
jgi:hypothetical protein